MHLRTLFIGGALAATSYFVPSTAEAGPCDPTVLTHGVEACKDSCLCAPAFQSGCEKQCNGLSEPVTEVPTPVVTETEKKKKKKKKGASNNPPKKETGCPDGTENCPCFNGIYCEKGLECVNDVCVAECVAPEVRLKDGNCGPEPLVCELPFETSCEARQFSQEADMAMVGPDLESPDDGIEGAVTRIETAVKSIDCSTPSMVKALSSSTGEGDGDFDDWPLFAGLGLLVLIALWMKDRRASERHRVAMASRGRNSEGNLISPESLANANWLPTDKELSSSYRKMTRKEVMDEAMKTVSRRPPENT